MLSISELADRVIPENTVLFLGSGASLESGCPTANEIASYLTKKFNLSNIQNYSLREIASIIEHKHSRTQLIKTVREIITSQQPTGSLLNIPSYDWKNIYTTNYDTLIEKSYEKANKSLSSYSSNFDFTAEKNSLGTKLFKIHGTITKDVSDGTSSRIIISDEDYDLAHDYKEIIYNTLSLDLLLSDVIIIGYSFADENIREQVKKIIDIKNKSNSLHAIYLLLYEEDENRAILLEKKGISVAFGSLDSFFSEIQKKNKCDTRRYPSDADSLLTANLKTQSIDIKHSINIDKRNASLIFNGWPANYADIKGGLTFKRTKLSEITTDLKKENHLCSIIVGASGAGKTTLAKQVLCQKIDEKYYAWEHKGDFRLSEKEWSEVAHNLKEKNSIGFLFIDDAHNHLFELNRLIDNLAVNNIFNLKIILTSVRNHWNPRIKTPNMFKYGKQYKLGKLDKIEIENLLRFVETAPELSKLVTSSFSGFSDSEKKRRLTIRCESDTFVCLKNIFASEKFDDILLREFSTLDENCREIYRLVAAMESSGIKVHRQLILRLLNISATSIKSALDGLLDIISEYDIDSKYGIYGWKGRHPVIMDILTKYKMTDIKEFQALFEQVIDNIVPSYEIEIRTITQLCAFNTGIDRIADKHIQNRLLRKMISKVPGERFPRHRLIKNLINLNEFEKAETEIRMFENDFKADAPVHRYKILLLIARSERAHGLLDEDKLSILNQANTYLLRIIDYYSENKSLLYTYCELGLAFFRKTKDPSIFYSAMNKLKDAEIKIGDPEITEKLAYYHRIMTNYDYY